ncbi:uncharacterized protein LOC129875781 [Solanum dulcamara]|uniref:uncharacterized protein LOC129875781 n=1 Tax=Solanum dulcamara TaxID=45834 RepID=UPI002486C585|nr:uncharacterized protein LOC129875781 [Solanum dulcamara]
MESFGGLGLFTWILKSAMTPRSLILPDGMILHQKQEHPSFRRGNRLCPGNDLSKLEISIFLHYFLLDYEPKDNCLGRVTSLINYKCKGNNNISVIPQVGFGDTSAWANSKKNERTNLCSNYGNYNGKAMADYLS